MLYLCSNMVKHTQTIRRQIVDELFQCVWPFCGIGASKYLTASLYSTYLHEKGSVFPAILPRPTILYTRYEEISFFLLIYVNHLRHIITARHIRNGCFFDSLFFTWIIVKWRSATAATSANLFLVFGMIPHCANTISKHGKRLRRNPSVRTFSIDES